MTFDIFGTHGSIEKTAEKIKEVTEVATEQTEGFHKNYVSEISSDSGIFGDTAKFTERTSDKALPEIEKGDWRKLSASASVSFENISETLKNVFTEAKNEITAVIKGNSEPAVEKPSEAIEEKDTEEKYETTESHKPPEIGQKIEKTDFPAYLEEIEDITGRQIPDNQKKLINKALDKNDFIKLGPEETRIARKEFGTAKRELIKDWENNTGKTWPRYKEDVLNDRGIVIRAAGQPYDAHHIVELSAGGPNEWWNIHPAAYPDEHQNGIHAPKKYASVIFG